jgi:hypothetical protein
MPLLKFCGLISTNSYSTHIKDSIGFDERDAAFFGAPGDGDALRLGCLKFDINLLIIQTIF